MLGPPWEPAPSAWSLHGRRLATAPPDTVRFTRALQIAERRPILGAVNVCLEVTALQDRVDLMGLLLDPARPPVSRRQIDRIADDLCLHVTGWQRWILERLWRNTFEAWPLVGGRLLADGVDVAAMPVAAASAAVFATWRHRFEHDGDAWRKWSDALVREPPRKIRRDIEESAAGQAEADFAAAQALMQDAADAAQPAAGDSLIHMGESDTLGET
ncbi:MAG: hypothetical protein QM658_03090 [Gordonia sp. (in: high G+C Gram-positive bacteria)]